MRVPASPLDRESPRHVDDRAISPVIAAVLLLGIAMLLVSILQTTAIPALNSQHEFEHNERVQTDLVRLDTTVDRVAATGTGETATVSVGLRYPPRILFVNPPPVSGTLRTTEPQQVTISNARARGETGDYWNGSARTFSTTSMVYGPSYNEYDGAPVTVYEPWVVYNRIDGQTLPQTEADLVDGRRISLVALDGQYGTSSPATVGVNTAPTSAPIRSVTVRNDTAPITLTIPTGLRNDTWARLLEDELDPSGTQADAHVRRLSCEQEPPEPCGELTLTLEPGTYDLRLGEVAVGSQSTRDPAVYLTDVEGNATTVTEGGRQRIVVEARDRFDNPVDGVAVTPSLDGDAGSIRTVTPVTEADGRAVFLYDAPDDISGSRSVTVTTRFGPGDAQRTVSYDLRLVDLESSGNGGTDGSDTGGTGGGDSSAAVGGVEGTIESRNIPRSDRGREVSFSITSTERVTITDFSVTTRDDLEGRPYNNRGTTFGGGELPVTFSGDLEIVLQDIDTSQNIAANGFTDPADPEADILVVLEFADGSTKTLAIS